MVVLTADVFQFFDKKEMRTVVGYRADGRENDLSGMTTATCQPAELQDGTKTNPGDS